MIKDILTLILFIIILTVSVPSYAEPKPGDMLDIRNLPTIEQSTLEEYIPEIAKSRIVYVGEQHDFVGDHITQLEIIRQLHELDPKIAIGLEMFQKEYQEHLTAYIAGEINEDEMLVYTRYFLGWSFDYRLYKPILRYARKHKIPVIALNVLESVAQKVSKEGIDSLTEEERKHLPTEITEPTQLYLDRMRFFFSGHPTGDKARSLVRFVQVQVLWDETMAESIVHFVNNNPKRRLVVLAGVIHVAERFGIPDRVNARIDVDDVVILPGRHVNPAPGVADFLIWTPDVELPK